MIITVKMSRKLSESCIKAINVITIEISLIRDGEHSFSSLQMLFCVVQG